MKYQFILGAALAAAGSGSSASELSKRVVGGAAAPDGDYSFVASIITSNGKGKLSACTGAFLSPTVVVTSARCVTDQISDDALAASSVVVGTSSPAKPLKGNSGGIAAVVGGDFVVAAKVTVHPGYNGVANTDNIAVVELGQEHPRANGTEFGAQVISKPAQAAGSVYTAAGWGTTAGDSLVYPDRVQAVELEVADKKTCTDVWAPYGKLTNSLCLTPARIAANVCAGDGVLVKVGRSGRAGLAGVLNIVADDDRFTAAKCTAEGIADFFTTFTNYVGWLTQVTPLKESDFVSDDSFDYTKGADHAGESSASAEEEESGDESSSSSSEDEESLDSVESDDSAARRVLGSALSAAGVAACLAALF